MEKSKVFKKELDCIFDSRIAEFTKLAIESLPDYFFTIPASSTGKYHPTFASGEGGLVRHTKAAVAYAEQMFHLEQNEGAFNKETRDIVIASLILHDGFKCGYEYEGKTNPRHPTLMANWIVKQPFSSLITGFQLKNICDCIASHMGQWNTDENGYEINPKPTKEIQKFVHLCDYLSSRNWESFL